MNSCLCAAVRIAAVAAAILPVFSQTGPVNLDFEQGQPGEVPQGWINPARGFKATLTDDGAKQGKMCAVITPAVGETPGAGFGNLMQVLDGTPYRGKLVRFRAQVKTEPGVRAQLWLRVDRNGGGIGFFDNMQDRPIMSAAWVSKEIVAEINEDAGRINIGMMAFGPGRAWIDDVSFETLGAAETAPVEAARPLTARGLQNIVAFARLFGYIRYFHPSDEAARADWEALAIAGARRVEDAASPAELAGRLTEIFRPVAPALALSTGGRPEAPQVPAEMKNLKRIAWRHRGLGRQDGGMNTYRSERITSELGESRTARLAVLEEGGIVAGVPVELFADEKGTLPHTEAAATANPLRYTANDRATRIGDVILAWNVFQHFYPYFDVTPVDWQQVLKTSLGAAASDQNGDDFLRTLQRMVAALKDGHCQVGGRSADYPMPLVWDWVEGRLIITHVVDASSGLTRGDMVVKIEGKPVDRALAEASELISGATPQWIRWRALWNLKTSPAGRPLRLEVEPANAPGTRREVDVARPAVVTQPDEPRPDRFAELEPGIFYFDPGRADTADWNSALPKLENARGIIFDFRGYPKTHAFLQNLTDKPMTSAQWHVPVLSLPDRQEIRFERGGEWLLGPKAPYLKAKRAFLTDGRAISYAESVMGIVEAYKLGEIVGGPTAGTNGNVNPFRLPGGYTISWTGMKVLKHDGSRHHGVGILPTVPVSRTHAGVVAGRDQVLERAIEIVKK